jgi:diguanylate cyclase (GGDEF)-like protein
MLPPILLVFILTYVRQGLWMRQLAGVVCALLVALTSLAIAEIGRRSAQPAIAGGQFVVILFAYLFLGLRYTVAVATSFSLVAIFLGFALFAGDRGAPVVIYAAYNLMFFSVVCAIGAGQLERARRRDFLNERILVYRAGIDELSGLANRRSFDRKLGELWENATENHASLALMMIDIDHFKPYNDHYGHQAGDKTITRVAGVLQKQLGRPEDFVARYGGEEFVAVLTDVKPAAARQLAERIRASVLSEGIEHQKSSAGPHVTVSIGLAYVEPHATDRSRQGLIQMADEALYSAKGEGRNRVVDAADIGNLEATGMFQIKGMLKAQRENISSRTA